MKLPILTSKVKPALLGVKRMFNIPQTKNWLRETGVVDKDFDWRFNIQGDKSIVSHNFNFDIYYQCYERIPKVFRAINTIANFAVQGGYKLRGSETDVEKIKKWTRKAHFDNHLITIAKEMRIYGNVFIEPIGSGDSLELKFLPVDTMKVRRAKTGEHLGFVQIIRENIVGEWKSDELIHIKWNALGTSPYGMSEIRPNLNALTDKLDAEKVLPEIIKFHADNRIVWKLGTPDRPYNQNQMDNWKSELEDRVVAGDVICAGDVDPVVIQPIRGAAEVIRLIQHVENQLNTGLNNPQILIEGRSDAQASLIQMDAFEREIMTQQDVMGKEIENKIFNRILNKEETPQIVWNPMNIETRLRGARTLRQLVGDGKAPKIIDINEAREELGYPEKEEMDEPNPEISGNGSEDRGDYKGQRQRGEEEEMPKVRRKD